MLPLLSDSMVTSAIYFLGALLIQYLLCIVGFDFIEMALFTSFLIGDPNIMKDDAVLLLFDVLFIFRVSDLRVNNVIKFSGKMITKMQLLREDVHSHSRLYFVYIR